MLPTLATPRRTITPAPGVGAELLRGIGGAGLLRGPGISGFERAFAARLQVRGGVAGCSGRMALVELLAALGLQCGDEVIFPAYTMESLPVLVREAGLTVRFADVDPASFQMTPAAVAAARTERTRAVIATHLFGTACDAAGIAAVCPPGVALIEDCAHAMGAHLGGRALGTFGRAAFFSFEIAKHINTFGGSIVTSDDAELLDRLRVRVESAPAEAGRPQQLAAKLLATFAERALSHPLPYTLLVTRRLDDSGRGGALIAAYKRLKGSVRARSLAWTAYQARLGLRQLERFDAALAARRRTAEQLRDGLSDLALPQATLEGADHTWYMAVVRVPDAAAAAQALRRAGVDCGHGEQLMQHCPRQDPDPAVRGAPWPGCEAVLRTALQLPLHPGLPEARVEALVARVRHALRSL